MSLNDEERLQVVKYRLEKANNTLSDAEKVIGMGMWATGANRLYYAAYYAVSALLIANGCLAKTHEGIIRLFNQHFVMNGIVDRELGRQYNILFTMRLTGDYGDCFDLQEKDVAPMVEPAQRLIETVSQLASKCLSNNNNQ
jgi:uncharacterized protein (UPF0332 family)